MDSRGTVFGNAFAVKQQPEDGPLQLCVGRSIISNIGIYAATAIPKGTIVLSLPRPVDAANVLNQKPADDSDVESISVKKLKEYWTYSRTSGVNEGNIAFFVNWNMLSCVQTIANCHWKYQNYEMNIVCSRDIAAKEQLMLDYTDAYMNKDEQEVMTARFVELYIALNSSFIETMDCLDVVRQFNDEIFF